MAFGQTSVVALSTWGGAALAAGYGENKAFGQQL